MKMETLSDKSLLGKHSKIIVMVISDHLNRKRGIVDFIRGFENVQHHGQLFKMNLKKDTLNLI